MIDLTGKRYLVTGGSGVLGRAVCLMLAEAGARVMFTWHNNKEAADKLGADLGNSTIGQWQVDVEDPVELDVKRWRVFDGLVHCAGVNVPGGLFEVNPAEAATVIRVNLIGSFNVAHYFLPLVRDGGSAVFIGSSSAYTGGPRSVHYAASKAGLSAMVIGAARAVAERGVRVNLLHPGYVRSPLADNTVAGEMVGKTMLGRLAEPEEVAGPVLWLLSDLSGYVTGQEIRVDGGMVV